ncbi:DUF6817 domain-containing protein [Streptomyces sp. NPDC015127]|uniref:DUF6817 domain-containing protein n=1 Tax=Streptomyces sp. NPDC015127 TaxID=3364939 RepID=UPI0036F79432
MRKREATGAHRGNGNPSGVFARSGLQLAGLCHAYYGTDGFSTALLSLDRRAELAAVIGATGSPVTPASPNLNGVTTSPSSRPPTNSTSSASTRPSGNSWAGRLRVHPQMALPSGGSPADRMPAHRQGASSTAR